VSDHTPGSWFVVTPDATGANGWAGKSIVAGLAIQLVDRMPCFLTEDAALIAQAPALLKERDEYKKLAEDCAIQTADVLIKANDLKKERDEIKAQRDDLLKAYRQATFYVRVSETTYGETYIAEDVKPLIQAVKEVEVAIRRVDGVAQKAD
jgi:hypothetical protein